MTRFKPEPHIISGSNTTWTPSILLAVISVRQEERSIYFTFTVCLLNLSGGNKSLKKFLYVVLVI